MSITPRANVLDDPLLVYAAEELSRNSPLGEIFRLDKISTSESVARDAYRVCEQTARAGSGLAMCMCSRFSRIGFGTARSDDQTVEWARKAADAGFTPGHYELGKCYEEGVGVDLDIQEARKHYELAAVGGYGFAAYHLAVMYHAGKFGDNERIKALHYAKRAYEAGEALAPITLAIWYEHGDGVIKNEREALAWYVRAADLGNFAASLRLSMAYARGELGLQRDAQMARKYEMMCTSQLP